MCDVTVSELLRRISLTDQVGNRPTSPAYRASCADPANERGVRVRHIKGWEGLVVAGGGIGETRVAIDGAVYSVPSSHIEFVTVDADSTVGAKVVVVNDAYRGCIGTLHSLAYGDYACVTLTDGDMSGRVLLPRKHCALIEAR